LLHPVAVTITPCIHRVKERSARTCANSSRHNRNASVLNSYEKRSLNWIFHVFSLEIFIDFLSAFRAGSDVIIWGPFQTYRLPQGTEIGTCKSKNKIEFYANF